ncbi:spore germination protein [Anaerosalibacter massiliensis]|uniref:Spore germination protein n=1 Tax=Anaerosalibacter massiliensis TaxID=1347392 RepID=A0A9X2S7Y1_9FIRM|nr:spore germination protein [Anaerosalibacter massiliensis]MCR2045242.1 spore germination protein [Anaerosalibacter massiliensis]
MISKNIDKNKERLLEEFNNTSDLIIYEFKTNSNLKIIISYLEGFIDKNTLDRDVLKPVITRLESCNDLKKIIFVSGIKEINTFEEIIEEIVSGNLVLFIQGCKQCFAIDLKHWDKRAIEEADSEAVVRGPKEGFIEDISTNKMLLRRKIRNPNLVFENYILGEQTETEISVAYIKNIVNEDVLDKVKKRVQDINTDSILESGYIEGYIEDSPYNIVSTIGNTQKPDIVAGKILEGRVAIFCDGTPHVLIIPRLFIENIQVSEDYYSRTYIATFLRMLRFFALFLGILLPGLYVALQTFHQEMIPTVLLITMAGAREGVPLPSVLEALLMTIMLELIKESGVRLPKAVGSAVSIVGALVLGQAAVEGGIVSAPMVIVIAITAIAEFAVPALTEVMILYRLFLIVLGGFMGLYGITCGLVVIIIGAVSLDPFGIPYGYPIAPSDKTGLKDFIIRFPLWSMKKRPGYLVKKNRIRQRNVRKK